LISKKVAHHEVDTSNLQGGEQNLEENQEVKNAQQEEYSDEDDDEEY